MTFTAITLQGSANPFGPDFVTPFFQVLSPEGRPYPAISADGNITAGSADDLAAYLQGHPSPPGTILVINSLGGDLNGGLRLGSLIRQRRLSTIVGLGLPFLSPPQNPSMFGECMSACTFAFLGGVERYIASLGNQNTSRYGLHRFYATTPSTNADAAMQIGQIITADILQYITVMGADPRLIQEMVKAGPGQINLLTPDQLRSYRVVTHYDFCDEKSAGLQCTLRKLNQ
jgi:hypothetical protein